MALVAVSTIVEPGAAHADTISVPYPVCSVNAVEFTPTPGQSTSGLISITIGGGNAYSSGCDGFNGLIALTGGGGNANADYAALTTGGWARGGMVAVALGGCAYSSSPYGATISPQCAAGSQALSVYGNASGHGTDGAPGAPLVDDYGGNVAVSLLGNASQSAIAGAPLGYAQGGVVEVGCHTSQTSTYVQYCDWVKTNVITPTNPVVPYRDARSIYDDAITQCIVFGTVTHGMVESGFGYLQPFVPYPTWFGIIPEPVQACVIAAAAHEFLIAIGG
jgi:hypothetical protein